MKKTSTRELILETAENLMLENSFHSVGLKQILDAVQIPKGSFYHYFKSKEQFGVEMLKHYMALISTRKRNALLSSEKEANPLKRLFNYLDKSIQVIAKTPGKFPCLAVKLASEVSDLSEPMCNEIAKGFEDWTLIYQGVLDEAVTKGLLPEDLNTTAEAQVIQDLWTGAAHRSVIDRHEEPVRNAVEFIKARIASLMT